MPRSIRKIIFWLHLIAGVVAGIFIFLMAVTGTLLTYERQIVEAFDHYGVEPSGGNYSLEGVLAEIEAKDAKMRPESVTIADPNTAITFGFGKAKTVYVDPVTKTVLGEGKPGVRAFFAFVTELHRWLALQEPNRETGKLITGVAALFFGFLILSGLMLWFPRRWAWTFLKRILFFQRRLHGPARDWNWHNVFGFWLCIPLLAITLSGVVIAFPWANNLVFKIAGSEPPPPRKPAPPKAPGHEKKAPPPPVSLVGLDAALTTAKSKVPGWQTISIKLPTTPEAPAVFAINESHRGRPDLRSQLCIHLPTGKETAWEDFSTHNTGRKARIWIRWIHTGEAGGWLGQTLAGISAIGAMILVWTGFALAWRRFTKKPPKAREAALTAPTSTQTPH